MQSRYRVVLTADSFVRLETVILAMADNPALNMSRDIAAGPIEPIDAVDPVRAALLAYREAHRKPLAQPYDDCTCHLCRAADFALAPADTKAVKIVQ